MGSFGYAGKIAIIDLTKRSSKLIDTGSYEDFVGGAGMATALFFDYCKDKTVDAYDPANVIAIATTPFSGTGVPSASGRCDFAGIGALPFPEYFVRSSMGGRAASSIKQCGLDAVVITGAADAPVWVNIVNDAITFEDASDLWGLGTHETQRRIWDRVTGGAADGEWYALGTSRDSARTTQKPSVFCIGPAGENRVRWSTVMHDSAHASGQAGFGAVWGAKNLKAMSFVGTRNIEIADPGALFDLRMKLMNEQGYDVDNPVYENGSIAWLVKSPGHTHSAYNLSHIPHGPEGCIGCFRNCRRVFSDGNGNEATCAQAFVYMDAAKEPAGNGDPTGLIERKASDLIDDMGLNGYMHEGKTFGFLWDLYKQGVVGPGCEIDSEDWDWDSFGSYEWFERYITDVSYRRGNIGSALAEGLPRAEVAWGRWEKDSAEGTVVQYPQWGAHQHYDPRLEVDWGYGSLFDSRDINCHVFNHAVHYLPYMAAAAGLEMPLSPQQIVEQFAEATGLNDPMCWDYSEDGIYSDARVRCQKWYERYQRTWINSMGFCDYVWNTWVNFNARGEDHGAEPNAFELGFYKAVTGKDATYDEVIYDLGGKIWNLNRAILVLQGRHRDDEVFTRYVYDTDTNPYYILAYENGEWVISPGDGRRLDEERFEDFKTRYYEAEGWDPANGWPTRSTLEGFGLGKVADELEKAGKLGKEG